MAIEQILQNPATPYIITFLLSFALLTFLINKGPLGGDKKIGMIIAGSISLLIVWGLYNYTTFFYSFSEMFYDIELNMQMIVFLAIGFLVLMLLWKGLKSQAGKRDFPFLTIALAIIAFLAYFAPYYINTYYLPDWFESFRWAFLIAGIALIILAYFEFKSKEDWADKLRSAFRKG